MKLGLVNDSHLGVRNDSLAFCNYAFKFWDNVFFPYLEKNNIKQVVHLGDVVDHRKFVNYIVLNRWRKDFFQRLESMEILLDVIVGNHDVPYKNTNEINAITELFGNLKNVTVHASPATKEYDGIPIAIIPWINSGNYQETMDFIKTTQAQLAFGHLEISGFEMDRGHVCSTGLTRSSFEKFETVLTGHFHHKSTDGHIFYLGSQYEMTWADYDDIKGFHVFDTNTRELTCVQNPYKMFHKIVYDDKNKTTFESIKQADYSEYNGTYLKIVVANKNNPYLFETFLDILYKAGPLDISIVEDFSGAINSGDVSIDQAKDTSTILNEFIDTLELDEGIEPEKLKNILHEIYIEAQNLEI